MRSPQLVFGIAAAAGLTVCPGQARAKERQQVTVSYLLAPKEPPPEGLNAVAVIDAGVATEGVRQDERERRWSKIAADMIEAMLQTGGKMLDPELNVVDRRHMKQILDEQDLRLAGVVEGETAARAGKLLNVQGLITSRITIQIDTRKDTKTTLDWLSILGGAMNSREAHTIQPAPRPRPGQVIRRDPRVPRDPRGQRDPRLPSDPRIRRDTKTPVPIPYRSRLYDPRGNRYDRTREDSAGFGGLTLQTKEVEAIRRSLTVQCTFSLIDAVTGRTIVHYAPPAYQRTDARSPDFLFGNFATDDDLDPVDHFIGELIEHATREFVSSIVPTPVEYTCELVGHDREGEAGIRALRADDREGALQHFRDHLRKEPDEADSIFALGVICELLGRPQEALNYYRQLAAAKDADDDELRDCLAAKDRLTRHLDRIVPSSMGKLRRAGPATAPAQEANAAPEADAAPEPPRGAHTAHPASTPSFGFVK